MANTKESMEMFIATEFLKRTLADDFDESEIALGDHIQKEPDVKYLDMGIELGAILSATNTEIDRFQNEFFDTLNEKLKGLIHPNVVVKVVMQEERDIVDYSAKPEFEKYDLLPTYLDGIFVHLHAEPQTHQVRLNQLSKMRVPTFPNPRKASEINAFVAELSGFVNQIELKEFLEKGTSHQKFPAFRDAPPFLHFAVCDGEVVRPAPDPLDSFFSKNILDKFRLDKYSNFFEKKILLLHNYNPIPSNPFTSDIHFYQHYRDNVLNRIEELIVENNSFGIYSGIHFVDFSLSPNPEHLELVDFSRYETRNTTGVPQNEGHIRC